MAMYRYCEDDSPIFLGDQLIDLASSFHRQAFYGWVHEYTALSRFTNGKLLFNAQTNPVGINFPFDPPRCWS